MGQFLLRIETDKSFLKLTHVLAQDDDGDVHTLRVVATDASDLRSWEEIQIQLIAQDWRPHEPQAPEVKTKSRPKRVAKAHIEIDAGSPIPIGCNPAWSY